MFVRAVYPGTFDPLTSGHEDICRRAGLLYEDLIVAVADSHSKIPLFSLDERISMAQEALRIYPNIRVLALKGLLVHFLQEQKVQVVLRGLRSTLDFEYETQLANMNGQMMPHIETLFMLPSAQYQPISATLVREIALMGGDVSRFVSPFIGQRLSEQIKKRNEKKA